MGIENAFDTTRHSGLICKLSKLAFSTSLIKLTGSFLSQREFSVSVEGEMSTPREMQAGVPQVSVLSPTFFNMYINYTPQTHGVHLTLFADDTALYAIVRKWVLLLENCSVVSAEWRRGLNAGISKLMKIRLRGSIFSVIISLFLILH
jgi:hypothetical protein